MWTSSLFFDAQGSVEQIETGVKQKFKQHLTIRSVVRQSLVELGSRGSQLSQVVPGACWEVMVLDMVAHVQVQNVPRPEVVVGLESHHIFEVLGKYVSRCRVWPDREEGNEQQVEKSSTAPVLQDQQVECDDEDEVENDVGLCFSAVEKHGSERVEQSNEDPEE